MVVLIIGILAAVALPQYQKAVKKTELAKYMELVKALVEAEEVYFLEHGQYATDIQKLDIDGPKSPDCTFTLLPGGKGSDYDCGTQPKYRYGIFDYNTNLQAGTVESDDGKLRYLQYIQDGVTRGISFKRGDIVCMAKGAANRAACKSFAYSRGDVRYGSDGTFLYWLK